MSIIVKNPPDAQILMESMRSIGYTFEEAITDVIDNSISAKATDIQIYFTSDPSNLYLAIMDNGVGMKEDTING